MTITAAALEAAPAGSIVRTTDGEVLAVKTTDADSTPWHAPKLTRAGGDDLWHDADSLARELGEGVELVTPPAPVEPDYLDLSPLTTAIAWAERDAEATSAILDGMTFDGIRELTMELATAEGLAQLQLREAQANVSKVGQARHTLGDRVRAIVPGDLFDGGTFQLARESEPRTVKVCSIHLRPGCTRCRA